MTITASLALLVYALVEASAEGWASATTIGRLAGSAALMAVFVAIELRSRSPILPFSIFRIRAVTGSNVAGFALGGAMFGMFFIMTLYMQQVGRVLAARDRAGVPRDVARRAGRVGRRLGRS